MNSILWERGRGGAQAGFSLIELVVVMGILAFLSMIMVVTLDSGRKAGLSNQRVSGAQLNARLVSAVLERDLRMIGSGLFTSTYYSLNGGRAGELLGNVLPEQFNYELAADQMDGFMVPPVEVTNGTDDTLGSYLNPVEQVINLTTSYRESNTDMVTMYSLANDFFGGRIDAYSGLGQENFGVTDMTLGARLYDIFENEWDGKPVLVMVIDDEGMYSTFRTISAMSVQAAEYSIKMEPSNDFNQPSDFKGFLEDLGYRFNGPGGPELLRDTVSGDHFVMIKAVTYFVYRNPAHGISGWLVRLDLPAMITGELDVDAADPDTIRPFVLAENVVDFQVALGIDSDENGLLAGAEWHNGEDMENYVHSTAGEDSASADYLDLVNNLREVRFTIISVTDDNTTDDVYAFVRLDDPNIYSLYPDEATMAAKVGVTAQVEDHAWARSEIENRLWYHRAVQLTRQVKIRSLDLGNTFARVQQ